MLLPQLDKVMRSVVNSKGREVMTGGILVTDSTGGKQATKDGLPSAAALGYEQLVRAVVQRVGRAEVRVAAEVVGQIGAGLLVLVGAGQEDDEHDADYLAEKIVTLRIFADEEGKMNRSLLEQGGALLAVSQFTLLGDARKGRRPSFTAALEPVRAEALYERFVASCRRLGVTEVATGRFRASMQVELVNDGPVTLLMDSKRAF